MRRLPFIVGLLCSLASAQVNLTIATRNDQTIFHIGETIPVVLSFTSPEPDRYTLTTADRRPFDRFNVNPSSGTEDPLGDYLHVRWIGEGGLTGSATL